MRLRHAIPFTLIAGIVAAACATAALAPEMAVRKAAGRFGEERRAAYTLSLHGDEQALIDFNDALIAAGSPEAVPAGEVDDMLAVLRSSLRLLWDKGDDAGDISDDGFAFATDVDTIDDAVEARVVDGTVYARARARRLAERFGAQAGVIEVVSGAEALGIDFLASAADGAWLAHDLEPIASFFRGFGPGLEQGFEAEAGFPMPDLGDFGPEMLAGLVDAFGKAYGTDVDVERGSADGPGDHHRLTASARKVAEHLLPEIMELPLFEGIPGIEFPSAADVPDEPFSLDLWIDSGNITRAEFDFAQIVPDGTFPAGIAMPRFALRVDIDRHAPAVTAPDDAIELDVFELFGKLAAAAEAFES
ncbi:MAG: hypothetical protein ACRDY7_03450 [Acidimicrobiia bacterium]